MATTGPTDVPTAFDLLLEAMQGQASFLMQTLASTTQTRGTDSARDLLDRIDKMNSIRAGVESSRKQWSALTTTPRRPAPPQLRSGKGHRGYYGRLEPGECTPILEYNLAILRALKAAGGQARTAAVLAEVQRSMSVILRPIEYEPNRVNREQKWHNRAQWARKQMVDSGLMVKGSRRGTWEISKGGLDYLANHGG